VYCFVVGKVRNGDPGKRELFVNSILRYAGICCLAASTVTPAFAQNSGADTYKAKCAMCHGADGLGTTPAGKALKAASFKDPAIVKAPDSELFAAIKNGKNKMPAYTGKLTDDQIKSAIAYIHTLQ
jgi:mono/diheme cytochrome c family protein